MPNVLVRSRPNDPVQLATDLAELWTGALRVRDWPDRLRLLLEIHEQMQDDLGDLDLYSRVSPLFVAQVIDRLGPDTVRCREQAHVYSNSADRQHRDAAGEWLAAHRGAAG